MSNLSDKILLGIGTWLDKRDKPMDKSVKYEMAILERNEASNIAGWYVIENGTALVQRIEIPGKRPRDRIDLCKSPVGH